jgi:hypothetical protein
MKDVYEVLRLKELEVSRLSREIEALRVAAPLLTDGEQEEHGEGFGSAGNPRPDHTGWQERTAGR